MTFKELITESINIKKFTKDLGSALISLGASGKILSITNQTEGRSGHPVIGFIGLSFEDGFKYGKELSEKLGDIAIHGIFDGETKDGASIVVVTLPRKPTNNGYGTNPVDISGWDKEVSENSEYSKVIETLTNTKGSEFDLVVTPYFYEETKVFPLPGMSNYDTFSKYVISPDFEKPIGPIKLSFRGGNARRKKSYMNEMATIADDILKKTSLKYEIDGWNGDVYIDFK